MALSLCGISFNEILNEYGHVLHGQGVLYCTGCLYQLIYSVRAIACTCTWPQVTVYDVEVDVLTMRINKKDKLYTRPCTIQHPDMKNMTITIEHVQ